MRRSEVKWGEVRRNGRSGLGSIEEKMEIEIYKRRGMRIGEEK